MPEWILSHWLWPSPDALHKYVLRYYLLHAPVCIYILFYIWHKHISHAWVEEPWDQRTVIIIVLLEKEKPCQSCLFYHHETDMPIELLSIVLTQYTKMATPPQDHTGCTPKLNQRLLGQGKLLCGRPSIENKPGEDHLLSCQWSCLNLNLNLRPAPRLSETLKDRPKRKQKREG